jgi:TolA-binding protein
MKRTERHHLKENEIKRFALQARETMEARRREVTAAIVALVVIAVAAIGYLAWRERVQSRAHALLADALAVQSARVGPPAAPGTPSPSLSFPTERERAQAVVTKFKVVADAYPSTDAGLFARYQEGAAYMTLHNPASAGAAYQEVIQRAGNGIYGQMARLGLAEAQARSGQYDQAITTYKEMSQRKDGPLPIDAILMQLGRTYLDAGKRAEAQQTFTRLVEEYPESPFTGDAKKELDGLKKT